MEDGRFLSSPEVTREVGIAYTAEKPIQLFAFNGVDPNVPSQTHTVPRLTTFSAPSPDVLSFDTANIRQFFRTLLEFKKRLDSIYDVKNEWGIDACLSYRHFSVTMELLSADELRLHNSIDGVALKNMETHTHAAKLQCEREQGKGIEIDPSHLQFKLFKPANCTTKVRMEQNDYWGFRFYVDFEPPISAGSEVKYAYRRKHFNYLPYTLEELEELVANNRVKSRIMAANTMIGQDFFVTLPTDKITFTIRFAPEYPVMRYKALVCYGKGEQIHEAETERVRDFIQLDHEAFDNVYTLKMEVPNPRLNLSYYLLYRPPKRGEIRK
jgi:hypothetical protein